jgi:predicted regulator of Ras-like GTPase activity (Roadblock/LC7/MglB family)
VLLISGIVNEDVRARAARARAVDVLSKPFAADDLLRRLEDLLAARAAREAARTAPPPAPVVAVSAPVPPSGPAPHGINGDARSPAPAAAPAVPAPAVPFEAVVPGAPATESVPVTASAAVLRQFAAIDGVQWAVLADREGFLLDACGDDGVSAEAAGALSACLTESSEGLGRELQRGPLLAMMLEYERGTIVLYGVGASALLAVALGEPAVLGKVRYLAKKAVPELLEAV